MFIKPIVIRNKKTGNLYRYYRLCQSYRIGDVPRHRTILNLGKLEQLPDREKHKILADSIERIVYKKDTLFELTDLPEIKRLSEHYARIIISKRLVDINESSYKEEDSTETFLPSQADYQEIDLESIQHQFVREIGAEWLCKQTIERLRLTEYLRQLGWSERLIKIGLIYLTGRAVFPASDNKSAEWIQQNSGVRELYGMETGDITRYHLYKVSRKLYRDKEKIEKYLSKQTGELFNIEDKILLYDLTNTYFEGEKKYSKKARFARSKEKRNDARLMALGLVTDKAGFIKYSRLFEGNIKDSKTLKQTLEALERYRRNKTKSRKIVVMDAGISTEDNLRMLRIRGYDYVCVALSKMKGYDVKERGKGQRLLKDKRGNRLWVKWLDSLQTGERILYVKSEGKQLKEESMEAQFSQWYEEGLTAIQRGIEKKGGIKKVDKVYERIGRLKEKYPSVHRNYKVSIDSHNGIATKMEWEKSNTQDNKQGVYFVRTTLQGKDEKTIWDIYNTIREIESTFRCLKTDLNMRPIFHQQDIYSESHIYGSILSYIIVNTIRYQLKAKGIYSDWSNIVRIMNSQKVITTTMQTSTGKTIYLRKCSEPEMPVREIYQALKYKDRPFWQKKSVLPKFGNPKSESIDIP
jgi:hypothetical protein